MLSVVIAVMMARRPILPVNIISEMSIFPSSGIEEVMPVDSPTVLNAEITSKRTDKNEFLRSKEWSDSSIIVDMYITVNESITRVVLLVISSPLMRLCQKTISFLPLNLARIIPKITAKVVTFIPPAIDPGEPPINIKSIITVKVLSLNADMSTVLKPAVLQVMDWKNDISSFVLKGSLFILCDHSRARISIAPVIMSMNAGKRTIFE